MTTATRSADNRNVNPIIIMLMILGLAMAMTWLFESGQYQRDGKLVIPGTYSELQKERDLSGLLRPPQDRQAGVAQPVSLSGAALAIPIGLERMAGLIFMVLIIGGMFGIMTHTGAVDAGLEKLLSHLRGNIYVLVPLLMVVFSAGSTFLGLASEYLLIIPLMVAMANRLGLSNLVGLAIVTVAVKAGYLSSVTNPIPLSIAQPLVGVPVFSGAGLRFAFYLVFLLTGIAFVIYLIRREGISGRVDIEFDAKPLSAAHLRVLLTVVAGIALLVFSSSRWHWDHHQLSAYYIALSALLALMGGVGASEAADAFVRGMKKILMASMLIGVAAAVAVVLEQGQVLDSIVHGLTVLVGQGGPYMAATGMFFSQLMLDFLVPSTSGQAAISMPILGPMGQLTGIQPQTTVLTFLFGNGITNLLTPTSGTLLAYLATAQVGWWQWARAVFWLWLIYIVIAIVLLSVAVSVGY